MPLTELIDGLFLRFKWAENTGGLKTLLQSEEVLEPRTQADTVVTLRHIPIYKGPVTLGATPCVPHCVKYQLLGVKERK